MALRDRQVREVMLNLERLKKLPNVLDNEMSEIAHEIQKTARAMAPIEYGGLMSAIKIRRTAATQKGVKGFVKGKSSFFVYIDPTQPAIGRKENFVGEYAWLVHEHMGFAGTVGAIMPSKQSIMAGLQRGEIAGGRFMDRAMNKHRGRIRAKLTRKCKQYISQRDFVANRVDK